jgi:hypothetical protein
MPDDLSNDPHASGTPGEAGPTQAHEQKHVPFVREIVLRPTPSALPGEGAPALENPGKEEPGEFTRIFQSLQSPRAAVPSQPSANRAPLDISQLLRSIDGKDPSLSVPAPVAPEAIAQPRSQPSASPEGFTQMFQALSSEPLVSPVTHPQENAAAVKLSAQPSAQDAASFTQVLNSLLRPAAGSPPAPPPEEQSARGNLVIAPETSLQQRSTSNAAQVDRDNEVTKIFAASHPQPTTPAPARSALQRYLPLLLLLNGALVAILGVLVFLFLKHR